MLIDIGDGSAAIYVRDAAITVVITKNGVAAVSVHIFSAVYVCMCMF